MKISPKKILYFSLSLLGILSLAIWYFFPVLMYKFTYSEEKLQKQLGKNPTYIQKLSLPPKEWDNIAIGELILKLPIGKYKKINGGENYINFRSEEGAILIYDITPTREHLKIIEEKNLQYPFTSLQNRLDILKSLPSDITFLNSRNKNMLGAVNQILKAISIPAGGLGEVLIVNPKILKAVCIVSENNENNGFSARVNIYSHNEAMSFGLMLLCYKDKATLNLDLLRMLGSVRVPNHSLDLKTVKKDIEVIVRKYNRT